MDRYIILCTEKQTQKALELGAPLFRLYGTGCSDYIDMIVISDTEAYTIPTTDQMIGWLEERGFVVEIILSDDEENTWTFVINKVRDVYVYGNRKDATLEAIDVALDYMMKQEGEEDE